MIDQSRPDRRGRFAPRRWLGARCLKLGLAAGFAVGLQTVSPALANFVNTVQTGPQSLVAATLAAPLGLGTASGQCSGGNAQSNVSLAWTGSTSLDANGSYLIDNYTVLRATTPAGAYALAATDSGQPPPATITDVNPSGAPTPQVFVSDGGSATVHAVNSSSNAGTSVTTGTMGIEPNGLAVTPVGSAVVAAEGASHQVQVITVSTDAVARTIALPSIGATLARPDAVAIAPDGITAYIVDAANDLVYPLTISSGTLGAGIAVGPQGDPGAIVITPDGTKVYVANYGGHSVSVISTSSDTLTSTVTIGAGVTGKPIALAVTPNSAQVYVADQGSGQIDAIATSSDTVTNTLTVGSMVDGNYSGGGDPNLLAITADGSRLYEGNYGAGTVVDIATATDTVTKTIALPTGRLGSPAAPNALALTPNDCQLYVNDYNNNQIDIIPLATDTVTATPAVGNTGDPFGMSVTPDSRYVYSPNYYDSTVSVIATSTNTVAATLATAQVGTEPYAVLATPSQYWYEVQAGHGGWRSAASAAIGASLGWNQGGWQ